MLSIPAAKGFEIGSGFAAGYFIFRLCSSPDLSSGESPMSDNPNSWATPVPESEDIARQLVLSLDGIPANGRHAA